MVKNLRSLVKGEKGVVAGLSCDALCNSLIRSMGIFPGVNIEVIGKAPLNDPVSLKVDETIVVLRNSEADFISVEVEG